MYTRTRAGRSVAFGDDNETFVANPTLTSSVGVSDASRFPSVSFSMSVRGGDSVIQSADAGTFGDFSHHEAQLCARTSSDATGSRSSSGYLPMGSERRPSRRLSTIAYQHVVAPPTSAISTTVSGCGDRRKSSRSGSTIVFTTSASKSAISKDLDLLAPHRGSLGSPAPSNTSELTSPSAGTPRAPTGPKFMSVATRYRRSAIGVAFDMDNSLNSSQHVAKKKLALLSSTISPDSAPLSPAGDGCTPTNPSHHTKPDFNNTPASASGKNTAAKRRQSTVFPTAPQQQQLQAAQQALVSPTHVSANAAIPQPTSVRNRRNKILKRESIVAEVSDEDDDDHQLCDPSNVASEQPSTLLKQLTSRNLSNAAVAAISMKVTGVFGGSRQPLTVEQIRKKLAYSMVLGTVQANPGKYSNLVFVSAGRVDTDWVRKIMRKMVAGVPSMLCGGDPGLHRAVEWVLSVSQQPSVIGTERQALVMQGEGKDAEWQRHDLFQPSALHLVTVEGARSKSPPLQSLPSPHSPTAATALRSAYDRGSRSRQDSAMDSDSIRVSVVDEPAEHPPRPLPSGPRRTRRSLDDKLSVFSFGADDDNREFPKSENEAATVFLHSAPNAQLPPLGGRHGPTSRGSVTAKRRKSSRGLSLLAEETDFFESDSGSDDEDEEDEELDARAGPSVVLQASDAPFGSDLAASTSEPVLSGRDVQAFEEDDARRKRIEEEECSIPLDVARSCAAPIGAKHSLAEALAHHRGRFETAASQVEPLQHVGSSNPNTPWAFKKGCHRGVITPRVSPVNLSFQLLEMRRSSPAGGAGTPPRIDSGSATPKTAGLGAGSNSTLPEVAPPVKMGTTRKVDVDQFVSNIILEAPQASDLRSIAVHHTPLNYKHVARLTHGVFAKMQPRFLRKIALRFCELDGDTILPLVLWIALEANGASSALHTLDLADNLLTAKDLPLISVAICGCPSLIVLSLRNNPLRQYYDDAQTKLTEDYHAKLLKIQAQKLKKLEEVESGRAAASVNKAGGAPTSPRSSANTPRKSVYAQGVSVNSRPIGDLLASSAVNGGAPGLLPLAKLQQLFTHGHVPPPPQNPEVPPHQLVGAFMTTINQLESIDFGFCGLDDTCVVKICNYLHDSDCRLKILNLDGANVTVSVSALLLDTVKRHCRSLLLVSLQYVFYCSGAQFLKKLSHTLRRRIWKMLNAEPQEHCGMLQMHSRDGPVVVSVPSSKLHARRTTMEGQSVSFGASFDATTGTSSGGSMSISHHATSWAPDSETSLAESIVAPLPKLRPLYFRLRSLERWCDKKILFRQKAEAEYQARSKSSSIKSSLSFSGNTTAGKRTPVAAATRRTTESVRVEGDSVDSTPAMLSPLAATPAAVAAQQTRQFGDDTPPDTPLASGPSCAFTPRNIRVVAATELDSPTPSPTAVYSPRSGASVKFVDVSTKADTEILSAPLMEGAAADMSQVPRDVIARHNSKDSLTSSEVGHSTFHHPNERKYSLKLPMPPQHHIHITNVFDKLSPRDDDAESGSESDISSQEPSDDEADVDIHDEANDDVVDDWGGWNLQGLKRGYASYTTNDPSTQKKPKRFFV